jgi:hypothetical protein
MKDDSVNGQEKEKELSRKDLDNPKLGITPFLKIIDSTSLKGKGHEPVAYLDESENSDGESTPEAEIGWNMPKDGRWFFAKDIAKMILEERELLSPRPDFSLSEEEKRIIIANDSALVSNWEIIDETAKYLQERHRSFCSNSKELPEERFEKKQLSEKSESCEQGKRFVLEKNRLGRFKLETFDCAVDLDSTDETNLEDMKNMIWSLKEGEQIEIRKVKGNKL